jgi:prolyl-tRNA editing enzyme YbaK/EbsC (Cys-tRNA(Pro) deacylase)
MAAEQVREYLKQYHKEDRLLEFSVSSATVELAAQALNVEPARIAKSISLKYGDGCIIIVTAGDAKIDNAKFKAEFGVKAKMLAPEEVEPLTGYQIGGVCPFGNPDTAKVYCDSSLRRFDEIYPAGGSSSSCVKLTCEELFTVSDSIKWVNVCKNWQEQ